MERLHGLEKIRIRNRDDGQVTVVGDKLNLAAVLAGIVFSLNRNEPSVAHYVCVCQDSVGVDDKPCADSCRNAAWIPGHSVVRFLSSCRDPDNALVNIEFRSVGNCAGKCARGHQARDTEKCTANHLYVRTEPCLEGRECKMDLRVTGGEALVGRKTRRAAYDNFYCIDLAPVLSRSWDHFVDTYVT